MIGDVLEIRPAGVWWFATAIDLQERLTGLLDEHPDVRGVRLLLDGLGRIDLTGAMSLDRVLQDLDRAGLAVELRGVPSHASELLDRYAARRRGL